MTKKVEVLENASIEQDYGYVTKDEMWAAIPYGKQYIIIHNGFQVHLARTITSAKAFIIKQTRKLKK